ncbi:MAG: L-serine ammonia-lyase, iron-sulfur-dependent, subunit alpha [Eggerthellaceae bacterium]
MEPLGLRDIIGPIMVGPSSSHTAGALRIARMARRLLSAAPARADITLYGSFAHTGTGHGTDKALVAGLLGLEADDLRIRDSFFLAKGAGLEFAFTRATDAQAEAAGVEHPNTVDMRIVDADGERIDVRGVSVGGGAAAIRRIDGVDVDISGKRTSVVVSQRDERGVLAHIARCLSDAAVNIATTRMYRTRRGAHAYTVMEVDGSVPARAKEAIEQDPRVMGVRVIPADGPEGGMESGGAAVDGRDDAAAAGGEQNGGAAGGMTDRQIEAAEERFARCDFTTGAELLALCGREGCSIAQAMAAREEALAALDGADAGTDEYLTRVLDVMRASTEKPLREPEQSIGGLIGGEAHDSAAACARPDAVIDGIAADAMVRAMAVLETNACMGRIVATPTAGSSGVLPGVLFALQNGKGFDDATLRAGVLTASAVGYLAARNATVSGAEGGCQAEVGTAAAMAAAAAVEMAGGTPAAALDAASNALCALMGLVCDPVGGLVEIPCQKRNGSAAAVALTCAQIALAGVPNLVPFDETVAAMDAVGRTLPATLRETALGGIAAAPSACAWCAQGCGE